jgi:hypothetical protein
MVAPAHRGLFNSGWYTDPDECRLEASRFGLMADIAGEQERNLERSRCLGWQRALLSRAENLERLSRGTGQSGNERT